jgi:hypothetical protein
MRIIAFLALLFPALASAQTFGGVGSRAEGMGGAFVAVADDSSAIYWNPAGLSWPTGSAFDAQFFAATGPDFFIGASVPVLGLSYYRVHQDTYLPTVSGSAGRQNGGSGEVQLRRLTTSNVGVSVLQSIVNKLVIGSTLRLVSGGVDGLDGRITADLDLGAIFSVGTVRLGLTGRNLRAPEFTGESGPVRMNRQVRVGAAYVPRSLSAGVHGPFSVSFDADMTKTRTPEGDARFAAIGGEYWVLQGRLAGRAGLQWDTLRTSNYAISGGVTVKLPYSLFGEGHLTKKNDSGDLAWGIGTRVTF